MINSGIFEQVKQLASKTFGESDKTLMDILYGFAKLVSMDKNTLSVLFSEESEQLDLANISHIFESNNIDVDLLKQAAPFFHSGVIIDDDKEKLRSVLNLLSQSDDEFKASQILEKLLEVNTPQIEIVKKGHSIDDVITFVKKRNKMTDKEADKKKTDKKKQVNANKNETSKEQESKDNRTRIDEFKSLIRRTTQLYNGLKSRIIGQDEAVRLFSEGFFQSEIFLEEESNRKKPSATFLFAGPPGVGKTHLAATAAEILDLPFLRVDMSEYGQPDSVKRLSGIPKTFASPKQGKLTGFVKDNPRSIILFDEIEKACDDVVYLFLQVLDGGVLTDEFLSESISFKDTIIIFTTNVGKKLYEGRDRMNLSSLPRSVVMKEIQNEKNEFGDSVFPSAICSRFASGNVIMFNYLGVNSLITIINSVLDESIELLRQSYGFDTSIDKDLAPMLIYSQSANMDARNMSSQASLLIKNELYEFGRHIVEDGDKLNNVERIVLRLDFEQNSDISQLFENNESCNILYIGSKETISKTSLNRSCNIIYGNKNNLLDIISKQEIDFVLIHLEQTDNAYNYLSLDDVKMDGTVAFDIISEKFPQIPVYLAHTFRIESSDKINFFERGARGFVEWNDDSEFADRIIEIGRTVYMQKMVDELSGRGRVLRYNSAQRLSDGNKTAEIIFYDFKIVVASDAEENRLILSDDARPKETFDDVIGAEDAKAELKYFVDYLRNPKKYMAKSIKAPKGILLYGPPGTGKTLLARAMAGESNVTFLPATATGFMNKYVGESENNIKRLFDTARKFAPSIIFIDEIDAIGKERIGSESTHHTESMLNALLTEMDGFVVDESRPVFVVAATNYDIDGSQTGKRTSLDSALLRRFDNKIYVDLPKEAERKEYLCQQIKKIDQQSVTDEIIDNVSQRTTGMSLAVLKNIIDLAIRNSNKNNKNVDDEELLNAYEEYMYGEKREWNEEYYKMVSIHESGHAYICYLSGEIPSFVTITSRGTFGGYMQHANSEKTPSYSRQQLLWRIRVALAGRAAEHEFFGENGINTGVSSDLKNATQIALDIICTYGMCDDGILSISPETVLGSKQGDNLIEKANEILRNEMEMTKKLVHDGKDKINALAEYLRKNNQATEREIKKVFE